MSVCKKKLRKGQNKRQRAQADDTGEGDAAEDDGDDPVVNITKEEHLKELATELDAAIVLIKTQVGNDPTLVGRRLRFDCARVVSDPPLARLGRVPESVCASLRSARVFRCRLRTGTS